MCKPKSTRGFNIIDICIWNKATISKYFLNLCKKKDRLWIQWVHMYYVKDKLLWDINPTQASWVVRKLIKAKGTFEVAGYNYEDIRNTHQFSIKKLYNKLRGEFQKVSWRRMMCNNYSCPKWIFVLQLVAHDRLYTKDRLSKWGIVQDLICPLCDSEDESIEHLFFRCAYSTELW